MDNLTNYQKALLEQQNKRIDQIDRISRGGSVGNQNTKLKMKKLKMKIAELEDEVATLEAQLNETQQALWDAESNTRIYENDVHDAWISYLSTMYDRGASALRENFNSNVEGWIANVNKAKERVEKEDDG